VSGRARAPVQYISQRETACADCDSLGNGYVVLCTASKALLRPEMFLILTL
jgi:hypothetical protein